MHATGSWKKETQGCFEASWEEKIMQCWYVRQSVDTEKPFTHGSASHTEIFVTLLMSEVSVDNVQYTLFLYFCVVIFKCCISIAILFKCAR